MIAIHYMVCLITDTIDYNKIIEQCCEYFRRLPKFHHITDVLMEFHWPSVRQ